MWVPAIACTVLPTQQDPKADNKENSRAGIRFVVFFFSFFKNHHCNTFYRHRKYRCKLHYNCQSKIISKLSPPYQKGDFLNKVLLQLLPPLQEVLYGDMTTPWQVHKAHCTARDAWGHLTAQGPCYSPASTVRSGSRELYDITNCPATSCSTKFAFFPPSHLTECRGTLPGQGLIPCSLF